MILADLLGWWYSRGWVWAVQYFFVKRNNAILDFFSIADLLRTLFSPFRQDSLQLQNAPIGVRLQAFGENIISRIFGLIIRSVLIITGCFSVIINGCFGLMAGLVWPLIPLLFTIGIVTFIVGVSI